MNNEISLRIQILRQKALANTLTKEELAEGIALLRQGRVSAAHASKNSRAKAATTRAKKDVDVTELLKGLDDL